MTIESIKKTGQIILPLSFCQYDQPEFIGTPQFRKSWRLSLQWNGCISISVKTLTGEIPVFEAFEADKGGPME